MYLTFSALSSRPPESGKDRARTPHAKSFFRSCQILSSLFLPNFFCCPFSVILQGQNHTLCLPGLSKMESQTPDTSLAVLSAGIMYTCVLFAWCVNVSRGRGVREGRIPRTEKDGQETVWDHGLFEFQSKTRVRKVPHKQKQFLRIALVR